MVLHLNLPTDKPMYCNKAHPTLPVNCDLEYNHPEKNHCHYGFEMDAKDIVWDDDGTAPVNQPGWIIRRVGLYKCCVRYLRTYLKDKDPSDKVLKTKTKCPSCNGSIVHHEGVWKWGLE